MTSPLFVDVYAGDVDGRPNWKLLASLGAPWCGAIVKATEGTWYSPDWFTTQWRALRTCAGGRYGADWFRGAYHFLRFAVDGAKQADFYLQAIEFAGGWSTGDVWPIVDVELGHEGNAHVPRNPNQDASRPQIIDCTTAFAERVSAQTGRRVMLYGNGAFRDKHITGEVVIAGELGCSYLWLPRYTPTLPREIYERMGWTLDELVLWQYSGDGDSHLEGYPSSPPGFGKVDVSALVKPIEWLRANLWAERP